MHASPFAAGATDNTWCCVYATVRGKLHCYDGPHCSSGAAIMAIRDLMNGERQRAAFAEAQRLADSGAYHDYTDIEYVLRFAYGLNDVSSLLDSQAIHRDLNHRCADARDKLATLDG